MRRCDYFSPDGANVRAQDWKSDTALDWARLRGDTSIVRLLQERSGGAGPEASAGLAVAQRPRSGTPRQTWQAGKDRRRCNPKSRRRQLASVATEWAKDNQDQEVRHLSPALPGGHDGGLARKHGFEVDEEIAREERGEVQAYLRKRVPLLLLGAELDPTLAAYSLLGFEAEDQPPDPLTDALVQYLVLHQHADGRWPTEAYRPPEDGSSFLFTALAVRGLQAYAPRGRSEEVAARITRARAWLVAAQPAETADRAFQLLGLKWAGAGPDAIAKATNRLVSQQRADGGWSQLPTLPSDAYATGLVLYALHEGGGLSGDAPAYQRGAEFLLHTQLADGSWYVRTRCFPALSFSSTGFPHGRSQFISAAATCWATMALILEQT